ncbi:MAG: hypothetical protein P8X64_15890 [Anaerolineales bacterium]|jgi:hypothetical protein
MQEERTDPVTDMEKMQRRAERRRRRRTSLWLSVLLPFLAGTLVIAALVAWAWIGGAGDASAWADTSLTFLMLPLLLLCLLPFVLMLALSYGLGKLIGWLPEPLDKVDHALGQVGRGAEKVTRAAVQPLIRAKAFSAAAVAGWARLGEIIRGERGEDDE